MHSTKKYIYNKTAYVASQQSNLALKIYMKSAWHAHDSFHVCSECEQIKEFFGLQVIPFTEFLYVDVLVQAALQLQVLFKQIT